MPVLSKGVTFGNGTEAGSANLNNLVDNATFASGAVDDSSTALSSGAIIVKDEGITAAKMAGGSSAANATRAKLNRGTSGLSDASTIATDASLSNVFTVTLGGNRTLGNPTNLLAGATYIWIITQDGTGGRTLAFGSTFKFPSGVAPTLTTTAAAVDIISGVYDGSALRCTALLDVR